MLRRAATALGCRVRLEHNAKKWIPVFCEYHATNKNPEQNADSELTHFALVSASAMIWSSLPIPVNSTV